MKIKKGDTVQVLAGKYKGYQGEIIAIDAEAQKVVVAGVNIKKKHVKASNGNEGGVVEIPAPIHVSNVALIDPKSKKPTRVGYEGTGRDKVRVAKKSGSKLK
jgi:large subunit ribosomal protein L24